MDGGVSSSDAIASYRNLVTISLPSCAAFLADDFVQHATQTSQGTKMPRANWTVLTKYPLPKPPPDLLKRFNNLVQPTVEMVAQPFA